MVPEENKKYPVSEWWQMGGLVFLTKRLIEKSSTKVIDFDGAASYAI
jgi:hypothetical protein